MMVKMNYTDSHDFFSNATLPLYGIIKQQSYSYAYWTVHHLDI